MFPITFRQFSAPNGRIAYEAASPEAYDTLNFLGIDDEYIYDGRMDRIYDWLTKLGHDVNIIENREEA